MTSRIQTLRETNISPFLALFFQVKKFRLPPSIRGFKLEQVMDNTLYLVCVVTRGSSWRSATSGLNGLSGAAGSASLSQDSLEVDGRMSDSMDQAAMLTSEHTGLAIESF